MFDRTALELSQDWVPSGFQVRKVRRPRKKAPDWIFSDKSLITKLCEEVRVQYQIAYFYWRLGWTSREIAEQVLGSSKKFKSIESTLSRIKTF